MEQMLQVIKETDSCFIHFSVDGLAVCRFNHLQKNIAQKETLELQVIGENPVVAFNAVIMKMCNLSSINIVENYPTTWTSYVPACHGQYP